MGRVVAVRIFALMTALVAAVMAKRMVLKSAILLVRLFVLGKKPV
jgi:hypothetical protein